jgi:hypothetical protein
MDFELEITKNDIRDIEHFIENYLVRAMNESGMSFPAMAIILQTVMDKKDELKDILESGDDNE